VLLETRGTIARVAEAIRKVAQTLLTTNDEAA
jgi:hypothetical protein